VTADGGDRRPTPPAVDGAPAHEDGEAGAATDFGERYGPRPEWHPETLAVHAGQEPDESTGAVAPPIHTAATFAQEAVGRPRGGWEYSRTGNPTRARLERAIAALDGAEHGVAFASGSAATAAVAGLVLPGEELVVSDDVYGGTYRYFEQVAGETGVEARYADFSRSPARMLRECLSERTRIVWLETPSNPLLKLIDIAAVAAVVREFAGARGEPPILVVDNTFATPLLQRPLDLGAEISLYSATKYLGGHSDAVVGLLATSRSDLHERVRFLQNAAGAVPGPFDCYLVLRGLRTLALRMQRHDANARRVAEALAARPDVARVRFPGLTAGPHAHPQAALAARQMRGPGGMVSFEPAPANGRSAEERARRFCEATHLFVLGESLGGVESLVELPAAMTHASVAGSALEVPASLVRLSVGIEHPDDLVADVNEALDTA
jgi:cystathionine beta-lyase/cystathionine gamma-synthase